jgi:hypothetical protein
MTSFLMQQHTWHKYMHTYMHTHTGTHTHTHARTYAHTRTSAQCSECDTHSTGRGSHTAHKLDRDAYYSGTAHSHTGTHTTHKHTYTHTHNIAARWHWHPAHTAVTAHVTQAQAHINYQTDNTTESPHSPHARIHTDMRSTHRHIQTCRVCRQSVTIKLESVTEYTDAP